MIKSVVILGGGTSAWLSAAYLSHNHPYLKITVVDKEVGAPVGVGEGTLLNFGPFLDACGFSQSEWFNKIDATYKTGILFPDWVNKGNTVWHSFHTAVPVTDTSYTLQDLWSVNQHLDFKYYGTGVYESAIDHNLIDLSVAQGYHVDCHKLVAFIQDKLRAKITLIQSEMVNINRLPNGNIKSLTLKNGSTISGDLFLDCTGFRGLLKHHPKRNTLEGRLICDTAIAGHVPYLNPEIEMKPYVVSKAVDIGWVWEIPVRTRIGSGLVFNRSITSPDEAKEFFVNYWDNRIKVEDLKVLDWTPYYDDNIWHENVVSIGLSAGFIEPLESTGIALIMEGIVRLSLLIKEKYCTPDDINLYNITMKSFFESAIDFVSMHYSKTDRDEPFWKTVKNTIKVSDKQKFYEEYLKDSDMLMPNQGKITDVFTGGSWSTWLIQMGYKVAPRKINPEWSSDVLKNWKSFCLDRIPDCVTPISTGNK